MPGSSPRAQNRKYAKQIKMSPSFVPFGLPPSFRSKIDPSIASSLPRTETSHLLDRPSEMTDREKVVVLETPLLKSDIEHLFYSLRDGTKISKEDVANADPSQPL
jgi:hypothetical protein